MKKTFIRVISMIFLVLILLCKDRNAGTEEQSYGEYH